MVHELVNQLTRTIADLSFKSFKVPWAILDWSQLYDDIGNDLVSFSFLQDKRNSEFVAFKKRLLEGVIGNTRLRTRWFDPYTFNFRTQAIEEYLGQLDRFRELLLIVIYLLGRQPARTTELLGLRYKNTSYGKTRNIFLQNQMVYVVISYHKGYHLSG